MKTVLMEIHVHTALNHLFNFAGATTPTPVTTGPTGPATTAPPRATSENMYIIKSDLNYCAKGNTQLIPGSIYESCHLVENMYIHI